MNDHIVNKTKIKQYLIQEEIGCGSYGSVYKGYDTILDRIVAIKSIPQDISEYSGLKEAKTLAKVNHPHIATIYEIIADDIQDYLVMEYIEGVILSKYIQEQQPDLKAILVLADKIVRALSSAHQHGIVHADIKPANIMITKSGEPKLIDFGLSQLVAKDNVLETLATDMPNNHNIEGTLAYISPEVIEGNAPTPKSDMFSLGIIIYELLTGYNPFKGQNNLATMNKILTVTPENIADLQPDIPVQISHLVSKMLEKSPDKRPANIVEIDNRLTEQKLTSKHTRKQSVFKTPKAKTASLLVAAILCVVVIFAAGQKFQLITEKPLTTSELITSGLTKLKAAEKKHNIDKAITQLQQALVQDPDSAAAHAALSIAQLNRYAIDDSNPKLLTQARTNAGLALALDDHLSLSHSAMAWVHEFTGEDKQAEQRYQQALLFDPANFFILEGYGRFLSSKMKYEQAITIYQQAIGYYPKESLFYNAIGEVYYQQQELIQAKPMFIQAIALAPENIFGYINLAGVNYMENNLASAIHALQQGLQIRPHPILYSNLGTIFFTLGQYPQAVNAFEQALNQKGNSHDYILWGNLADAYRWSPEQKTKAISTYKQALNILAKQFSDDINDPTIESRRALYQAKANMTQQALDALEKALQLAPNDANILYRATIIQEIIGQRGLALEYLQKSLSQGYPLNLIQGDPELALLRKDSRYRELLLSQTLTN